MEDGDELEYGASLAEAEVLLGIEEKQRAEEQKHQHPTNPWSISSAAESLSELRERICSDIVGDRTTYPSPFTTAAIGNNNSNSNNNSTTKNLIVPLVYCDHTATHRSLRSIESFVTDQCLPWLGNTHTVTSLTGCQSTSYVAEARQIVAECVHAKVTGKASTDVVLFTGGAGVTSAVQLLIDILKPAAAAVVFVGPYEHHSNLIPWRECGCEIVTVPIHHNHGGIDMEQLENLLSNPLYGYTPTTTNTTTNTTTTTTTRLRIGTFSVASNVTGRITDTQTITALLHKYHVLSFWDYATGASYLPTIDMNPSSTAAAAAAASSMDALFLSPHKLLGGSGGSSGILIVKKYLVSPTQPPHKSGGGTVFYVTNNHHRFLSNRIDRYEGGSPNIPSILRTGLTFLYKRSIQQQLQNFIVPTSDDNSNTLDYYFSTWNTVVNRLSKTSPNLILLGSSPHINNNNNNINTNNNSNLPIFSFLIQCGTRFLHHNFVCALLNDMFGIQTRGGCQCAGPYSQYLLGLTNGNLFPSEANQRIEEALITDKIELLRVGFTRLSLPYLYMRDIEMEYVLKALEFTAKHGWKFLYLYRCNHRTGEWRHYLRQGKPLGTNRKWLHNYIPPFLHPQSNGDNNNNDNNETNINNIEEKECCKSKSGSMPPFTPLNNNHRSIDEKNINEVHDKLSLEAWRDILDQTLENANVLLQQVYLDTKSIVPIMNATANDDDILPHSVQDLRWFVYPSECAKMLYEGIEPTWQQQPQPKIVGAIQPLERNPPTRTAEEGSQQTMMIDCQVPMKKLSLLHETTNDGDTGVHAFPSCAINNSYTAKKPSRDSSLWGRPCNTGLCSLPNDSSDVVASYQNAGQQWKNASLCHGGRIKPPAKMMRLVTQAVLQWKMIEDGDRLLLGLSGGKDSLSLLHCLLELQRKLPISFTVQVCTIDPMTPSFDPSPLIPYVRDSLGLQYHYIRADIVSRAATCGKDGQAVSSLCAFCARMKRGHLYQCAREHGYNKLVLAQHLDDMAESFLMSVMHNGFVRTMKAHYEINAGDLAVIRPLAYCRESLMAEFAKSKGLPVINENCPACFEEPKERARVKKLLSKEGMLYPQLYDNIRKAILPLMHEEATAVMRCLSEEVTERTRKEQGKSNNTKSLKSKQKTKDSEEEKKESNPGNDSMDASFTVNLDTSDTNHPNPNHILGLAEASEEQLVAELTRRRAEKYRLHGAMTAKKGFIPKLSEAKTLNS